MAQYMRTDPGFFDFRVYLNGAYVYPDFDATLFVEIYDNSHTLRFTATTSSSPALQKTTDIVGDFIFCTGIDLTDFELGNAYIKIYAQYASREIIPYPTTQTIFEVVETAVYVPGTGVVNTPIYVNHTLTDSNNQILLGLTHDEVETMYISGDGTARSKSLSPDNFVEKGAGVYQITYSPDEVYVAGLFVSVCRAVSSKEYDLVTLGIVTPTGVVNVTGDFLDLQGNPEVFSPITLINKDFTRVSGGKHIMGERSVVRTGLDGHLSFYLVPGSMIEIVCKRANTIVEVPDTAIISLEDLLELGIDNNIPIDYSSL
jgi:hypothetical protein